MQSRRLLALCALGWVLFTNGCNCGTSVRSLTALIEIEPASLDFGPVPVGIAVALPVEIRNTGEAPLRLQPPTVEGNEFETASEAMTIAPNQSLNINVVFTPSATGTRTGLIHVRSDASNRAEVSIPVTGLGIASTVCGDCSSPPASYCASASFLVRYERYGTCVDNQCQYSARSVLCEGGCANRGCASASDGGSGGGGGGGGGTGAIDAGNVIQQGYIKASNTGAGDHFGRAISLSADGNTLAVGAPEEDSDAFGINGDQTDNSGVDSGAVYILSRSGSSWSQQAYLKASDTEQLAKFGASVALSGDGTLLAVGSPNAHVEGGIVYLFARSGTTWAQQARIGASNANNGDHFGVAVSLNADGTTLVVGATGEASSARGINGNESDNLAASSGAAYVFTRNGVDWTQQAYLKASNAEAADEFGIAVSLNGAGDVLAVGAHLESSASVANPASNGAFNSGAVYVFSKSGANWSQQAFVKASNPGVSDLFGSSVALSLNGNTLAVGASGEGSNSTGINGNQADDSAQEAGAVYVFANSGSSWVQQAYVKASNAESRDNFGFAVAVSADGNTLVAGAHREASNAVGSNGNQNSNVFPSAGAAYVFSRNGSSWSQRHYLKASNTESTDFFGFALGLSGDGVTLAVDAYSEDSDAVGVGGNQLSNVAVDSGAVYVFAL